MFPRTDATPSERCEFNLDVTIATDFPRTDATPGERYMIGLDITKVPIVPRTSSKPGEISAVELGCRTVWGLSQIDSAPGECGAVERDFRWASFLPGENGVEECDYIWLPPLAGSSVCARTVTGSLLFGSPHRLVRSCLYSVVLSLQWIDDIDISRDSMGIPQNHHLGTVVSRIMPDICISVWTVRFH